MEIEAIAAFVLAYLIGSVDFGAVLPRFAGVDIYTVGSGNPGTSNVARTMGRRWAAAVLAGDLGKGVLAVAIADLWAGELAGWAALLAVVAGHCFPIWHAFRGGKGVAASVGGMIWLAWPLGLAAMVVWAAIVLIWKMASVASLVVAAMFAAGAPLAAGGWELAWLYAAILLVVARHSGNIRRLVAGEEQTVESAVRPLADAQRDVLAAMPALAEADVALADALGLVTATPVLAPHDVPPFTNSAMDGYAVIAADLGSVPVTLEVLEDVPAGSVASSRVRPGTAIKIMTGAPLPGGADAVVPVEDTTPGNGSVEIHAAVATGASVRPAGGDLAKGTPVLAAGVRLGPAHLGMLASLGVPRPRVRRRPVAAVMSTGDEVLPPDADLSPGKIRDSNRPMLRALLAEAGAQVIDLGIVGDDEAALRSALVTGAERADVVITSGGVSMGEYDLVKAVLADLGEVDFWKVAMQPAKPFAFGTVYGTPLFGLPGNPVSSMVAFEQFVRPGLLRMMGATALFRPRVPGILDDGADTNPDKTVFVRVTTHQRDGEWHARLSGGQDSNVLSALAAADAFAVVPVGTAVVEAGGRVELEMFRWPETRAGVAP